MTPREIIQALREESTIINEAPVNSFISITDEDGDYLYVDEGMKERAYGVTLLLEIAEAANELLPRDPDQFPEGADSTHPTFRLHTKLCLAGFRELWEVAAS